MIANGTKVVVCGNWAGLVSGFDAKRGYAVKKLKPNGEPGKAVTWCKPENVAANGSPSPAPEPTVELDDSFKVLPTDAEDIGLKPSVTVDEIKFAVEPVPAIESGLAAKLKANRAGAEPHLIIVARAGTGKTTTLISALQVLMGQTPTTMIHDRETGERKVVPIVPSEQQKAIWDAIAMSKGKVRKVCLAAFNKSIAVELQTRVPAGCDAMTMHSMGFKAVQKASRKRLDVNKFRVGNIVAKLKGWDDGRKFRNDQPLFVGVVEKLVGLCKGNLLNGTEEELADLVDYFDLDLEGVNRDDVFETVPAVLEKCKELNGEIDFNDMIWLPVVLGLPLPKYDLLLIDEAQDLNRGQQAIAKLAGNRLVFCGDPKQAIYGFAGADAKSMERLADELGRSDRGVMELPLTMTRRCGKAIVAEAQKLVPDFEAHESNGAGEVKSLAFDSKTAEDYRKVVADGDMVLSRVNAPLVSECFRFLKAGRKANIQGRDIGDGLISLVTKMKATTVVELIEKLGTWRDRETEKEEAKKIPSEARLINIQDKYECVIAFTEGRDSVEEVIERIEEMFTEDRNAPGIKLSSIHKAKGLEAPAVYFFRTKDAPCPHPMATTGWAREQENNLVYVAVTRAIKTLVFVR